MAIPASRNEPQHLRALVDMGSNGIRFSISSLQPGSERVMPTLYQHRTGISLYDAQYSQTGERMPIKDDTITAVLSSFKHFKVTCQDFDVPESNITVLATEATRTALNSEEFRTRIKGSVGWDVTMLSKEEEGRVGAMGVASSLPHVAGLVMDLGGGSTQLSWLIKKNQETIQMPDTGAMSMPYGAAAMTRRLAEAEKANQVSQLRDEVFSAIKDAVTSLKIPTDLTNQPGGLTLYLSGGGFRGWGYVLMSQHKVQPYPIPVINGFKASRSEFLNTDQVQAAAAAALDESNDENIFRVSDRRASQVPAVAFLVEILATALPAVQEIRFCQGGVREGFLFSTLSPAIQAQDPLVVATQPFADGPEASQQALVHLLQSALPASNPPGTSPNSSSSSSSHSPINLAEIFSPAILTAFANLLFLHAGYSKDLQTGAALRTTTSGALAGAHGLPHESRALLALLLRARWGGPLPPADAAFQSDLEQVLPPEWGLSTRWWVNYLGAVAGLVAEVFPAGILREPERLEFGAGWRQDEKGRAVVRLTARISAVVDARVFEAAAAEVEKVGKRKRWIGGREGVGFKVVVEVVRV